MDWWKCIHLYINLLCIDRWLLKGIFSSVKGNFLICTSTLLVCLMTMSWHQNYFPSKFPNLLVACASCYNYVSSEFWRWFEKVNYLLAVSRHYVYWLGSWQHAYDVISPLEKFGSGFRDVRGFNVRRKINWNDKPSKAWTNWEPELREHVHVKSPRTVPWVWDKLRIDGERVCKLGNLGGVLVLVLGKLSTIPIGSSRMVGKV